MMVPSNKAAALLLIAEVVKPDTACFWYVNNPNKLKLLHPHEPSANKSTRKKGKMTACVRVFSSGH